MTIDNGIQARADIDSRAPSPARASVQSVVAELNRLCADIFALYIKTKNFHWHISGPHFRDYHLLLDEQADELFAMTDEVAERVRKLGQTTIRSVGHIARLTRVADNDTECVEPISMLVELRNENEALVGRMRDLHDVCDDTKDVATASLLENWIDQGQRRAWFLLEAGTHG